MQRRRLREPEYLHVSLSGQVSNVYYTVQFPSSDASSQVNSKLLYK